MIPLKFLGQIEKKKLKQYKSENILTPPELTSIAEVPGQSKVLHHIMSDRN